MNKKNNCQIPNTPFYGWGMMPYMMPQMPQMMPQMPPQMPQMMPQMPPVMPQMMPVMPQVPPMMPQMPPMMPQMPPMMPAPIDPDSPLGEWFEELKEWLQQMPGMQEDETEDEERKVCPHKPPMPNFPWNTKKSQKERKPFSWLTPEKTTAILKILFDASNDTTDREE